MKEAEKILREARERGQAALSEYESKKLLGLYGVTTVEETIIENVDDAKMQASRMGYPVVLKLCAPEITHKSEMNLIEINIGDESDLKEAFSRLLEKKKEVEGDFLLQRMVRGKREYVLGMMRDPSFGPCVMFGLGGIFTEMLRDVAFRVAPIEERDAYDMMDEIFASRTLDAVRGMEAVDRKIIAESLIALGNVALENDSVREIDVNPMIVEKGRPVAVDALVVLT